MTDANLIHQMQILEEKCSKQAKELTILHTIFCDIETSTALQASEYQKLQNKAKVSNTNASLNHFYSPPNVYTLVFPP